VKLFEIFDDEIAKYYESASLKKNRDPKILNFLQVTIDHSHELRRNVSAKGETERLIEVRRKLAVQNSDSVQLISNYLSGVCDSKRHLETKAEQTFGEVVFAAGLNDLHLFVHLKSVNDLKPRPNRDEVNLRLVVSVLPLKMDDKSCKVQQETLAYNLRNFQSLMVNCHQVIFVGRL